jgi:restriction system protein
MAIPDYQTIMLPLLQLAGDKQEHKFREAIESLADSFNLTGSCQYVCKKHLGGNPFHHP